MTKLRVVLDTYILVSSLLFRREKWSWLREAWKTAIIVPILCPETTLELVRVLSYPKFQLSGSEQRAMLAEVLPHCETAGNPDRDQERPACKDEQDQVFIDLALAAKADHLVSGDKDLLEYPSLKGLSIITAPELKELIGSDSRG